MTDRPPLPPPLTPADEDAPGDVQPTVEAPALDQAPPSDPATEVQAAASVPDPEPFAESGPEPVAESGPEPVAESGPEPVAESDPEPAPEPQPAPAPLPPAPEHALPGAPPAPARPADRPEILIGAAFVGGLAIAFLLRRLASR